MRSKLATPISGEVPKMNKAFHLMAFCLTAVSAACGQPDEGATSVTLEGAPQSVNPTPILELGGEADDPSQTFYQVRARVLFTDGRVAVPLGSENLIRVFDGDGALVEDLGGEGEGPGEFAFLSSAWSRGDTVEAADGQLRRITRFGPDGAVEVIRLQGDVSAETSPPGALPNGWVAGGVTQIEMNSRDQVTLYGFSREGELLDEVARTEGIHRIAVDGGSGVHPLSPRGVVRVGDGRIYVGETMSPRIRVLDLDGTVVRDITWEIAETVDPEAAMGVVREAPDPLPTFEHLLDGAPTPDRLSVFWDFLVDELGFIWVEPYDPTAHAAALGGLGSGDYLTSPGGGAEGPWLILSPTGEVAGYMEIPQGLRPTQITTDRVVGIHVDSLGIESVQVHTLSRK
jgi:hypothetical protein